MVSEMCPKKQFYYQKNVRTIFIVKFEFLGYNVHNLYCAALEMNELIHLHTFISRPIARKKRTQCLSCIAKKHFFVPGHGMDPAMPNPFRNAID